MTERNDTIAPALIISDSVPNRNGVGSYYQDLTDHLTLTGHNISIICPQENKRSMLRFPMPGDDTQGIWLPSIWRFNKVMRRVNPSVIVIATPGPFGLLGCWWAKRLGAKMLVGFHTDYAGVTDLFSNPLLKYSSRFYFNLANRFLFKNCDLVLANSEDTIRRVKQLGASRVESIGTLLPVDAMSAIDSSRPQQLKRIIFAGRLSPEKQVPAILEAAAELPQFEFVIAGDGPLRNEIKGQCKELSNVNYLGWIKRKTLLKEIDNSDLLILPSTLESFGTVALEAMARARLVLVSKGCGIVDWPELAEHIFQIDDDQSIANALLAIAEQPPSRLKEKAHAAGDAAKQLHQTSFKHWLNLLGSC